VARLTITDHRGALERGEEPTRRTVEVGGLAPEVAGELAAVVLGLPPAWSAPGPGTHRCPKAGGQVVVTITDD
jgi:hypothetical protein